jgi:hypothetical protein
MYWWPIFHKNTMMFCKSFDECEKIRNLTNIGMAKLVTTLPSNPFTKWELVPSTPWGDMQTTNIFGDN